MRLRLGSTARDREIDTLTPAKQKRSRLRLTAASLVEQQDDTQAEDNARYAEELCPSCGEGVVIGSTMCACGYTKPMTAAFGAFDESKHPRKQRGEKGGGQFTVRENAAGRFEVVNDDTGKKVAETTDEGAAQTVADEKNAGTRTDVAQPHTLRNITNLANDGGGLSAGPSLGDFSARDLQDAMALNAEDLTPDGRETLARHLAFRKANYPEEFGPGLSEMYGNEVDARAKPGSTFDPGTPAQQARRDSVEGPFTYQSGWQGKYDPAEGRYLGMDDIYMPADFDPHRPGGGASAMSTPQAVAPAPVSPKEMFHAGAEAAIRQGETGDSLHQSNARAARAAVQALESGDVVATDEDYRAALDRLNRAGGTPERSQLNTQLDVVKGLALGRLPRRGDVTSSAWDAGAVADPEMDALIAAIPVNPPADWFFIDEPEELTPMTITADGLVYGHAAGWGTCHLGNPRGAGVCVQPPVSQTDYALFHLGELQADGGEKIAVGQITLDTGHAPMGASARTAAAHYDDTGAAVVDVRARNGAHGIFYSGALRPDVTPSQLRKLTASKISGDWRGGELVGMLCVNVPGFPIPRTQARLVASVGAVETVMALVAAGIVGEQRTREDVALDVYLLAAAAEGMDPVDALVALAEA